MNFLERFFCFVDDERIEIENGIKLFSVEIFNVVVFGIDFDDEDICLVLCNVVFGFEYK